MSAPMDVLAVAQQKLDRAMEALELAEGVMDYCGGDAWERECTEADRTRFAEFMEELRPSPPAVPEPLPIWPTRDQVRAKYGFVRCGACGKKLSGHPDAIKQHARDVHAGMRVNAIALAPVGRAA